MPQVVATAAATGALSPKDEAKKDHLVRNVGIAAVAITALLVAVIITPDLMRDKWELHNTDRVSAKLEEAGRLQRSDPLAAYKIYDEVLKEAQQHKITDEQFLKKLADAENSRTVLYQKVEAKIRAEEAEKQRLVDEEARRAAAEKQRVAEGEARKRAAEESQRIAEEKRLAEEKRRKDAVSVYRNAPPSARNALNAVKKVEARAEFGVNFEKYSTLVGEAWADVKIFVESPDGKKLPEFSFLLVSAMGKYKLALDIWHEKIQEHLEFGMQEPSSTLLQQCWGVAHRRIDMAESLISGENIAAELSRALRLQNINANYEATVRSVLADLKTLATEIDDAFIADYKEHKGVSPEHRAEYLNKTKELSRKMDEIDKEDKQGP